jgi:hypothetical protein
MAMRSAGLGVRSRQKKRPGRRAKIRIRSRSGQLRLTISLGEPVVDLRFSIGGNTEGLDKVGFHLLSFG